MVEVHSGFAQVSGGVWPWIFNHLWQSTLFVLTLIPAAWALRRAPARLRYSVSLVASLKFLLPSTLLFVLMARATPRLGQALPVSSWLSFDLPTFLARFQAPAAASGQASGHPEIYCLLTLAWALGAAALGGRWYLRSRAFTRMLAMGETADEGREHDALERVRARLGLRRRIRLVLLDGAMEAGVFGSLRPALVLPAEMPRHLTTEELEALFLHELVHVRRWDNLVANLHMALCCLFWFHPVVWLLDRRLLAEREEACDERVLELAGGADTYLRSLLKAVRFGIGFSLAGVSRATGRSNFLRRIERIRSGGSAPTSPLHRGLIAAVLVLLAGFSMLSGTSTEGASALSAAAYLRVQTAVDAAAEAPADARRDRCAKERAAKLKAVQRPEAAKPSCSERKGERSAAAGSPGPRPRGASAAAEARAAAGSAGAPRVASRSGAEPTPSSSASPRPAAPSAAASVSR